MKEEVMNDFNHKMTQKLGEKFDLKWDIDKKGVVCGWCSLVHSEDIYAVAEVVADFKGRMMTISPLNTPAAFAGDVKGDASSIEKSVSLVINYHFFLRE